jgi:hypothetical protein
MEEHTLSASARMHRGDSPNAGYAAESLVQDGCPDNAVFVPVGM